jgi:hypothetical protein
MDNITGIVAVLGTLSLSVERVVQMIKNMIPFLSKTQTNEKKEGLRRTIVQLLAVVVGAGISYLAKDQIQPLLSDIFVSTEDMRWHSYAVLGLLASGGSGLWNHTLSIVEEIKKAKKNIKTASASG